MAKRLKESNSYPLCPWLSFLWLVSNRRSLSLSLLSLLLSYSFYAILTCPHFSVALSPLLLPWLLVRERQSLGLGGAQWESEERERRKQYVRKRKEHEKQKNGWQRSRKRQVECAGCERRECDRVTQKKTRKEKAEGKEKVRRSRRKREKRIWQCDRKKEGKKKQEWKKDRKKEYEKKLYVCVYVCACSGVPVWVCNEHSHPAEQ